MEKAVRVANALKSVIVAKNLISNIQGKAYPQVEAWLTLASMLRLTTVCEWSRPVQDGWEARVFVRDGANNVIGAAEAQCLKTERTKKSWEDYAIRSMAQTRATSKALRSVLGFIMVLAGYQATPAEEMPDNPEPPAKAPETPQEPRSQRRAVQSRLGSRWTPWRLWTGLHDGARRDDRRRDGGAGEPGAVARRGPGSPSLSPGSGARAKQPLLRAVPDEDPPEKERQRMWALSKTVA